MPQYLKMWKFLLTEGGVEGKIGIFLIFYAPKRGN